MLAIIGLGNHVTKNILPALKRGNIDVNYIVVREIEKYADDNYSFELISNLNQVLSDSVISHIYIATPLSSHYELTKKSLQAGKHVLCEKPLTNSLEKTQELFKIAEANNLFLDEMVMFKYHRQFTSLCELVEDSSFGNLIRVSAKFQIPHLEGTNIRYSRKECGGALYDVGFYPLALYSLLFEELQLITGAISTNSGYAVDLNGTALLVSNNIILIANWAIGAIYRNELLLEYADAEILIKRVFTKPYNLETEIEIIQNGMNPVIRKVDQDDHFLNQFKVFLSTFHYSERVKHEVLRRSRIIDSITGNYLVNL